MFREGIPQARGGGTKGSVPNCASLGPWRKEPVSVCGTERTCDKDDLIRIRGQVWKILMLERVWPAGLAKAKYQEGQTTRVGHPKGM